VAAIYRRTELAHQMARQLLNPGALDEGLRSGLFLSGMRRIGKTTFMVNDLIPALEGLGAIVIYVDLWSDTQTNPKALVLSAVRQVLKELQTTGSRALTQLKRLSSMDLGVGVLKFGFKLDAIGTPEGPTLAQALAAVVDQAQTSVVLIVDEVQHAITSEDGQQMMLALKAARDAINPRPDTKGHFIFIGTGSHRALVSELTARRNQAFAGATSVPYPVLGGDYVAHLLARLHDDGITKMPSQEAALDAFNTLGNRPEEMLKALRHLVKGLPDGEDPDKFLRVIAQTLRSTAADIELMKVEQLGGLATAVFDKIAMNDGEAKGLFSSESASEYSKALGRDVRIEEIQPVVNELMGANLIMRRGHGVYGVTDPFVQEIWRERKSLSF
jgi:hypothetical protein